MPPLAASPAGRLCHSVRRVSLWIGWLFQSETDETGGEPESPSLGGLELTGGPPAMAPKLQ